MSSFSDKIKQLRNSRKMSLDTLAMEFSKRYDSKISKSSISRWENKQASHDIEDANLYADYFNVSLDWLMGREEMSKPETIAAHIDDNLTEEEMDDIKKYIEFIKAQRK